MYYEIWDWNVSEVELYQKKEDGVVVDSYPEEPGICLVDIAGTRHCNWVPINDVRREWHNAEIMNVYALATGDRWSLAYKHSGTSGEKDGYIMGVRRGDKYLPIIENQFELNPIYKGTFDTLPRVPLEVEYRTDLNDLFYSFNGSKIQTIIDSTMDENYFYFLVVEVEREINKRTVNSKYLVEKGDIIEWEETEGPVYEVNSLYYNLSILRMKKNGSERTTCKLSGYSYKVPIGEELEYNKHGEEVQSYYKTPSYIFSTNEGSISNNEDYIAISYGIKFRESFASKIQDTGNPEEFEFYPKGDINVEGMEEDFLRVYNFFETKENLFDGTDVYKGGSKIPTFTYPGNYIFDDGKSITRQFVLFSHPYETEIRTKLLEEKDL